MNKTDTVVWTPSLTDIEKEREWITKEIERIGIDKLQALAKQAATVRAHSYCPYSKYKVGVAILTVSGNISTGVNAEVASYSESDHAEESAITGAIVDGEIQKSGRKFIRALAVSHESNSAPCGRCRQIITEHCDNAIVVVADPKGVIRRVTSLKVLLPYAFTPSDLGIQ